MQLERSIKYVVFGSLIIYMSLGLASMVSRLMLFIQLLIYFIYTCKCWKYYRMKVVNGFYLLLLLNIIYYLIGEKMVYAHVGPPWETTGFFANIILNLSVFFYSYKMSIEKKISQKEMVVLFIFLFLVTSKRPL